MICFNCGLQLHSEKENECPLCGVKFADKCPVCKAPNPLAANFCFNCGNRIKNTAVQSSVQNFQLLSESRKYVAVIFADISGFTALAENMDPEEVREIINECFRYITRPVYELEGTIDKYIGDCVMILFGAKYSHGDDARRAVVCAMRMMELVRQFSDERLSAMGYSLNISVGINYGLVVTGSVGNYFDKDYTVMGDIVNTAQRLQASAGQGTILVSESVYMETRDKIEYSKPREVEVKNRKSKVRCYSPIRLQTDWYRQEKSLFIERENELRRLSTIYNNAHNTGTQIAIVVGEAGVGKTRLLKEFVSNVKSEIKKVWVDLSPIYQNKPYYLISKILTEIMNTNIEDSTSVKQHRLASFLDYILNKYDDEEIKRNYNFLGLLLGFNRDPEFQSILNAMSYEDIRREIIRQLSIFFSSLCEKQRLLVVVEDIHWADPISLQVMKNILPFLPEVNAMFIFSSRRFVEWLPQGDGEKIHIIELSPLSGQSIKAMVCNMLECENLDPELYDVILRFTNGNPLYIEEFISHIKRNGKYNVEGGRASIAVDAARQLPNSIHGLILSEMSELDETTRTVLQTASVIGKDFNLSLLNNILDQPIDEMNALKIPIQMNIISLKTVYTFGSSVEKVFTFNHDLAREVIYDSILNKNKRELHQRIGEYIEEKKQKEIENYYETLYLHFSRAGNNRKAWDYCFKTAVKHKSDYNFHDSLNYYGIFTNALESKGIKDERIMQAYRDMGYIHSVMAQYDQALEYLNKALRMAFLSDDKYMIQIMIAEVYKDQGFFSDALEILDEVEPAIKQEHPIYGKILQMRCGIYFAMGKAEALFYAEKARNILLKVQDFRNLSETNKQMGILYFSRGNADSALRYLNESYTYAEKANDLEMMAKVSGNLGIVYHAMGMVSKALEFLERSMELSKRISYLRGYVAVCINLGILYMDKGYFEKSLGLFNESLQKAKEIDNRLHECISLINLGDVSYELGLFEQARNYFLQSLEVARQIHVQVEEGVNYIGLAKVYLKTEAYDKVPKMLDTAYEIFKEADDATYFSDYYFYKGLYELQQGRSSKALEYCEKAIAAARGCKNDSKQLKALRLKGNIHLKKKDYKNALLMFEKAITLARQIESDYELAKGYYGSYQVLSRLGRTEEALERLEKAKETIVKVDRCRWTDIILWEDCLKPADSK